MPSDATPQCDARHLVLFVCATTFLLWLGASAIVPLLPTYLSRGGASSASIGLVMASYFAFGVLTQYPVGRLSDRIGRRAVVVGGLVVFVLGSLGFARTSGAAPAILFRSLQGIGAGAVTVGGAASIASAVAEGSRGRSFALLYGTQSLALAVGPLVGGFVGASSMSTLFLGAAALASAAAALAWFVFPPAPSPQARARRHDTEPRHTRAVGAALLGALVVFAAEGLLTGLYESVWSLLLHDRGATSVAIGLSWTLYCLPYAGLSTSAGRLADRGDRRQLVVVGLVSSALFATLYPELTSVVALVILGSFEAFGAVLVVPAALSVAAEASRPERLGATQGALETARTAATAVAAAGCGALYGAARLAPFDAVAFLLVCSGAAVLLLWRSVPRRARQAARPGALAGI